jgi:spectinomycin phosphotransferase
MLIKPEIQDETIIACLHQEYGLRIIQLAFLPLGGDLCSAVYRAAADDGTAYYCKLRCSDFEEISVALPNFLSSQGLAQIIPPLVTRTGRLWAGLDAYNLILYPFIEGTSGFEVELSERQWVDFGTALQRIHTLSVPSEISRCIPVESYSPEVRETVRNILHRLQNETFEDPIMAGLADYLASKRETILDLSEHAERLAHLLASRPTEFVLCHTDIHPGNLFIETSGALFIVDWDYPMFALKERDLMFIGGGQGYMGISAQEEEMHFYRNYGASPIDPDALAYYRCERNLIDLSVECPRILSPALGDQERAHSMEILTWLFLPGGSIEMAYKALDQIR